MSTLCNRITDRQSKWSVIFLQPCPHFANVSIIAFIGVVVSALFFIESIDSLNFWQKYETFYIVWIETSALMFIWKSFVHNFIQNDENIGLSPRSNISERVVFYMSVPIFVTHIYPGFLLFPFLLLGLIADAFLFMTVLDYWEENGRLSIFFIILGVWIPVIICQCSMHFMVLLYNQVNYYDIVSVEFYAHNWEEFMTNNQTFLYQWLTRITWIF